MPLTQAKPSNGGRSQPLVWGAATIMHFASRGAYAIPLVTFASRLPRPSGAGAIDRTRAALPADLIDL